MKQLENIAFPPTPCHFMNQFYLTGTAGMVENHLIMDNIS